MSKSFITFSHSCVLRASQRDAAGIIWTNYRNCFLIISAYHTENRICLSYEYKDQSPRGIIKLQAVIKLSAIFVSPTVAKLGVWRKMPVIFPNKKLYQHQSGESLCYLWMDGYRRTDVTTIIFVFIILFRKSIDTIPAAETHQLHTQWAMKHYWHWLSVFPGLTAVTEH